MTTADATSHGASARDVLFAVVGLGLVAVLLWGAWAWYQHRLWLRQMEACNRLGSLCAADCPASREILDDVLEYRAGAVGPELYESGCVAGCNKAEIFCSGVFGLTPAPPGWAE